MGLVWYSPHDPPYCFRLFHATTRSKFRCFFLIALIKIDCVSWYQGESLILNRKERFLSLGNVRQKRPSATSVAAEPKAISKQSHVATAALRVILPVEPATVVLSKTDAGARVPYELNSSVAQRLCLEIEKLRLRAWLSLESASVATATSFATATSVVMATSVVTHESWMRALAQKYSQSIRPLV